MLVAHLTDPHIGPLPRLRPSELFGKRSLGLLNWRLRRRFEHRPQVLQAIVADLQAHGPDAIVVTGDLVNVALENEFAPARAFLALLGTPERVSFVPGNHDAYVRAALAHAGRHWREYMSGDGETAAAFPFVRRRGRIVVVGVSSAIASPFFHATGRVGAPQLERLDAILGALAGTGVFRIVLIHHPPAPFPGDRRKQLIDAQGFLEVLRRHGADLVLHGHSHRADLSWLAGPDRPIPLLGAPSASAAGEHDEPGGYNLIHIDELSQGWRCEAILRGVAPGSVEVRERARRLLTPQ